MSRLLFTIIILLSVLVRFWNLSSTPPALNWDEVSHGYNAYSILRNGTDEWGERLPLIFRAYGDYKLPVYIYTSVVSIAVFGLNEFAVRFPSALAGVMSVIFTYLLTKLLTKNIKVSLVSAFLVSISPWSFFLSRVAVEANLALALIIGGIYFWLVGIEKKNWKLLLGILLLGLSVWTYNSARIFVPLLLFALHIVYRKEFTFFFKSKLRLLSYLLLATLFFLPMFYQLFNPVGSARYNEVRILDEGAIAQINELRNSKDLNPQIERLLYNKATYFVTQVSKNYISYFSPEFLFVRGGSHYQFSIPGESLLYIINLPFFIIGFALVTKRSLTNRNYGLLLCWILLAPIAASITRDQEHVLRSIVMLPMPFVYISLGVLSFWEELQKRINFANFVLGAYVLLISLFFIRFFMTLSSTYQEKYSWAWQYGYKEVINYSQRQYNNYDKIIMSKKYGEPHEFVLFYSQWDPKKYLSDKNLNRFSQSNWFWVDGFDKYYFVNDWQIQAFDDKFVLESKGEVDCSPSAVRCLLITSPGSIPQDWNKLETIYFLDNTPAFEIYEN